MNEKAPDEAHSARRMVSRLLGLRGRTPRTSVAAVDLGSNSFHLIVARAHEREVKVLDRLQEMVRLAAGLRPDGRLDKDAQRRALECLGRFGERLRGLPAANVRVVGTSTLRSVRHGGHFLKAAEKAIGHRIEVISGQEEARLIYQGVVHNLPRDKTRRLVIDIGGGSTEVMYGDTLQARLAESLSVGCVNLSRQFFPNGLIDARAMRKAETAARLEFKPVESQFRNVERDAILGASGTIRAAVNAVKGKKWCDDGITPAALAKLKSALVDAGRAEAIELPGVSAERAEVFAGGIAILSAAMEALVIDRLHAADGALREGLLYDLVGRFRDDDVREQAVNKFAQRYHVDEKQAQRVSRVALELAAQVSRAWEIGEDDRQVLDWAAHLHEVGLTVAHTKYHHHGSYLVGRSDLPGFSWQEQAMLAALVRGHRRRFPVSEFKTLPKAQRRMTKRLCVLLRLAVLLNRGRSSASLPPIRLKVSGREIVVRFPRGWLGRNPLTLADLAQEAERLRPARLRLTYA